MLTLIINFGDFTEKKAPFAVLSKTWQAAIERYTFGRLYIQTKDVQDFRRILSTKNRRASLYHLTWRATLPPYRRNEDYMAEVEKADEQLENDAIFTQSIVDLFSALKSWEKEMLNLKTAKMLELEVDAVAETPEASIWGFDTVNHNRFMRSLLHLNIETPLPILERPISFETPVYYRRYIDGSSTATMASAFANLMKLNIRLFDNEKLDPQVRQQHRYGE